MPPDPPYPVVLDERYMADWIMFGWSELVSYLTKHANFDAWCLEHPQKGDPHAGDHQ